MKAFKLKSDKRLRDRLMVPDSFHHPAKGHLGLWEAIIDRYTKPGDWVLDPMAGVGSTLLAALMGRNVICVELEEWMIPLLWANWQKMRQHPMLGHSLGEVLILRGDARALPLPDGDGVGAVLTSPPFEDQVPAQDPGWFEAHRSEFGGGGIPGSSYTRPDAIVTSPPYENLTLSGDSPETKLRMEKHWGRKFGASYNMPQGYTRPSAIVTSPPWENTIGGDASHLETVALNPDGSNRLSAANAQGYTRPDAIVTSPPYEGIETSGGDQLRHIKRTEEPKGRGGRHGPGEAERQNVGYTRPQAIITSPPYENSAHSGEGMAGRERRNVGATGYTRPVDAVVTSPPYEGTRQDGGVNDLSLTKQDFHSYTDGITTKSHEARGGENIGNQRGPAYWEAMRLCYMEMRRVLRPGGLLVLVLKGFTRTERRKTEPADTTGWSHRVQTLRFCACDHLDEEHTRSRCQAPECDCRGFRLSREEQEDQGWVRGGYVDLPQQTADLVTSLGFAKFDHWRRELWSLSFWRILQRRRDPEAFDERLRFEEVVAFRKPEGEGGGVQAVVTSPPYGEAQSGGALQYTASPTIQDWLSVPTAKGSCREGHEFLARQ